MDENTALTTTQDADLAPVKPGRADLHPAAVFLARLAPGSRPAMRQALDMVSDILSSGTATVETFPWHQLRYQHTGAAKAALLERYQPRSVNKILAALRGVLKEAFRLELMSAEDYHRAVDLPSVKVQTLPRGREVPQGELRA
jgi:hypothetical protein